MLGCPSFLLVMVNKEKMKSYIFIFLLALLGTTNALAQSADKRLNNYTTDKGDVYFIGEKKLESNNKDIKKFGFDMTYVSHRDSVTVNFTVITKNHGDISKLTIGNGTFTTVASNVNLLYHEIKGKYYVIRTTSQVSYKDIKKLYTSPEPVIFNFTNTEGKTDSAEYTASDWKKEIEVFDKIFYIINK